MNKEATMNASTEIAAQPEQANPRMQPLIVRYVVPEYALDALDGVAVEITMHEDEGFVGVYGGVLTKMPQEGMFRLYEVTRPDVLVIGSHICNVREVVVS